jgi:hypothetical protein
VENGWIVGSVRKKVSLTRLIDQFFVIFGMEVLLLVEFEVGGESGF